MKTTISAVIASAMVFSSAAFAGEHACCAKGASHDKAACANFDTMNLTADQKSKLEAWQTECTKAGCTKESRAKFLKRAKGILSADQYAKLKENCEHHAKESKA